MMAKRAMHFKFNFGRTKGKGHKQPQSGGGDGALPLEPVTYNAVAVTYNGDPVTYTTL
jgi:hypothetical protein